MDQKKWCYMAQIGVENESGALLILSIGDHGILPSRIQLEAKSIAALTMNSRP